MEQLWVIPEIHEKCEHLRPATPAEVLAAAATLDGAIQLYVSAAWNPDDLLPDGNWLCIPLPDKETTDE